MARDWDYAQMSKEAKKHGGPEQYLENLVQASKSEGKREMLPWVGLAALVSSVVTVAVPKAFDYFKSKKKKNEAEIATAKEELINGIKEYDATHPDEEGGDENA